MYVVAKPINVKLVRYMDAFGQRPVRDAVGCLKCARVVQLELVHTVSHSALMMLLLDEHR